MAIGSITFGGLASGLPSDIVDQLMKSEQTRLQGYQTRKSGYETQQSAFSSLSSKLLTLKSASETLQDSAYFTPYTATSSDTDEMTVASSSTAMEGVHSVAITQLATFDTHATEGLTASSYTWDETQTDLTADSDFKFTYMGKTFSFDGTINDGGGGVTDHSLGVTDGMTLANIAQTINDFDFATALGDTDEKGISASIMYDGSKYRMVMTSRESGSSKNLTVDQGVLQFSNGAAGHESLDVANNVDTAGQDANMTVNGVPVTSTSNTVEDVIPGITMTLLDASGTTLQINVNNDTDTLKSNIQGFVDSYNDVIDYINQEKGDNFSGESLVRSVISSLRSEINTSTTNTDGTSLSLSRIASLGIQTDSSTGKLAIDSTDFSEAVGEDFDALSQIFTTELDDDSVGTKGLSYRLDDLITELTKSSTGQVAVKTSSLSTRIDSLDDSIDRELTRLEKVRERLTLKFANLEQLINNMNGSSQSMLQALNSM